MRGVRGSRKTPFAQAQQMILAHRAQDPLVVDRHASPLQFMRDLVGSPGILMQRTGGV
jgi:hypothetical protein